ncbi:MAG: flavodoxin family protein, partial [Burkholderiales bacterium]
MKTLLIVFHTKTGGAQQMAQAAHHGASTEPDVTVRLLRAADAQGEDILQAEAYIFVTPENLASMAGIMK